MVSLSRPSKGYLQASKGYLPKNTGQLWRLIFPPVSVVIKQKNNILRGCSNDHKPNNTKIGEF